MSKKIINDAGEKIGGAKKDLYGKVSRKELENLYPLERERLAQKSKIWRGNEFKNIFEDENLDIVWAIMLKNLKESISAKPYIVDPFSSQPHLKEFSDNYVKESMILYVDAVAKIRDIAIDRKTYKENALATLEAINENFNESEFKSLLDEHGSVLTKRLLSYVKVVANDKQLNFVENNFENDFNNNYNAFSTFIPRTGAHSKINKHIVAYMANYGYLIEDSFEKIKKYSLGKIFKYKEKEFLFRSDEDIVKLYKAIIDLKMTKGKYWSNEFNDFIDEYFKNNPIAKEKFEIVAKSYLTHGVKFKVSNEEAQDDLKNLDENEKLSIDEIEKRQKQLIKDNIKQSEIFHLASVERVGYNWRLGKDVDSEDFINDFGFRAVEFGESLPNKERQVIVNLAYDSFCDLAYVLNINKKELNFALGGSLEMPLAIAFGSRGRGTAMAHFEPDRNVINLTRLKGAGSLAHELGHALEHALNGQRGCVNHNDYSGNKLPMQDFLNKLTIREVNNETTTLDFIDRFINSSSGYNSFARTLSTFLNLSADEFLTRLEKHQDRVNQVLMPYVKSTIEKMEKENNKNINMDAFVSGNSLNSIKNVEFYVDNNEFPHLDAHQNKKSNIVAEIKQGILIDFPEVKTMSDINRKNFTHNIFVMIGQQLKVNLLRENKEKNYPIVFSNVTLKNKNSNSNYYNDAQLLDGGKSKAYYTQPTELGARAFDKYIAEKLEEKGFKNEYLTSANYPRIVKLFEIDYFNHKYNIKEVSHFPNKEEMKKVHEMYDEIIIKSIPKLSEEIDLSKYEIIETHEKIKSERKEKNDKEEINKIEVLKDDSVNVSSKEKFINVDKVEEKQEKVVKINETEIKQNIEQEIKKRRGRKKINNENQLNLF